MKSPRQYTPQLDIPQAARSAFASAIARRVACILVQAKHASLSCFSLLRGFISNNCSHTTIFSERNVLLLGSKYA